MSGKAAKTPLTETMHEILSWLSTSRSVSYALRTRAKMILLAFQKQDKVLGLIGISCEDPEDSGRPVADWTGKELADEARKRGLRPNCTRNSTSIRCAWTR
jgi:hypothetical protein